MEAVERVEFRYSNRLVCYLTQVTGMAASAYTLYFIFSITIGRYLSGIPVLYPVVLVIFDVASFVAIVFVSILLAVKVSDRHAYADFYSDRVIIALWLQKITINYTDVKRIDWYWIQFGSNKNSRLKRKKHHRLKIHKPFGKLTIAASFMETNAIAKSGGDLSLKMLYERLRRYSKQKNEA